MAGPYFAYILAAYGVTALAILVITARAVLGYRQRLRRIGELEAAGARRRGKA